MQKWRREATFTETFAAAYIVLFTVFAITGTLVFLSGCHKLNQYKSISTVVHTNRKTGEQTSYQVAEFLDHGPNYYTFRQPNGKKVTFRGADEVIEE